MNDVEFDLVPFFQALVSIELDRAVMHKHVGSIVTADEAVSLRVIEPLHFAFVLSHVPSRPSLVRIEHEENKLLSFTDASQGRMVFLKMRVGPGGTPQQELFCVLFLLAPPQPVVKHH